MINTLQLIFHLPLVNIKMPGDAALFFNLGIDFFKWDFLPDKQVDKFINMDKNWT